MAATFFCSIHKFQFALRLCENHDRKELHAYCKTCEKKICSSCIKEEHHQHDWETITDILREKKRSLPEECKEIRTKNLPGLTKEIGRFDRKIQEEEDRFGQNKSVLNSSRQIYIDNINKIFDDRIDECQQKSEAAKQIYEGKRDGLKQKVEYLDMVTKALDKDINTLPDHDILDMEKEMREELDKALSYGADKYTCTTVFVSSLLDVQALKSMIGEIQSVSMEETNGIDKYLHCINSIKPVSDTKAWITLEKSDHAKLLNRTGEELGTTKTPCYDILISKNGEFVLSDAMKHYITFLTKDEDTITTIDTKQLCPTYISKTENDDILVTLIEIGDLFNLLSTNRRIVQRMTLTGKVVHTYEFREDGKTRLFTFPTRTAENKNTDVCVVNWPCKDSGELVVLHKDGRMKYTYKGEELKHNNEFSPGDVECDDKCRILFTEQYSRAIHMLNAEGMYLCTVCQYEKLHPVVISIHGEYIWCGFHDGRVKVFKYLK